MTPIERIEKDIARCMLRDRHRLRRRLDGLRRAPGGRRGRRGRGGGPAPAANVPEEKLGRLRDDVDRSIDVAERRRARLPRVEFDPSLPICERREEIAQAIRENQVVVVCGETGSGKSTQLPKICLDLGRGVHGLIGHTQPRRIAARSVAARVAEEIGTPLGNAVGYKVRFADETGPHTFVKLMTDGILLAESQGDRFFEQYDTIIIDEAHERSLNIDFLLGMLRRLTGRRPELKIIITSATIDAERFAAHFPQRGRPAPVIEVSGRTYPIETRYRPVLDVEEDETEADASAGSFADPDWQKAVTRAVDEVARIDTGDILIFMPTERDIHETAKALRAHRIPGDAPSRETEILPLYARLSGTQQQRVFKSHPHRRIVIATNVAESSLTVPGIRYVIDPGTARISRYSARSKTQRLPIEKVSRASADQRAGRCGRVGPGVCIRLYSEDDYAARDQYTTPEIQRTNLASVILQAKAFRLGAIEKFPFLEPPRSSAVKDGYNTLSELGAIDDRQQLTDLGRRLSRWPVDPRIGRVILAAEEEDCLAEMLIIASVLEIQDPRERPLENRAEADAAHSRFLDEDSDFLSYLKLWDFYQELKQKLSRGQLRKACRTNFLSANRMREWGDIHHQLLQLVHEAKMTLRPRKDAHDAIHRALVAGLLSNVAQRGETYEYSVGGGGKAVLWPGSGLFKGKTQAAADEAGTNKGKQKKPKGRPKWVVAAELIETSNRYLRTCGRIRPEWIETIAPHLVRRSYSQPRWSREQGTVMADERVTLFGLTIIPRRPIRYGPINAKIARELFIRYALVEGEFDSNVEFFVHNRRLFDEMQRAQSKLRKHDFLRGDWARFEFYDQRIPDDVYDAATLSVWWKQARREQPNPLFMRPEDLIEEQVEGDLSERFPDRIAMETHEAPLEYRFEPGEPTDGITLTVPLEGLKQLDARRLGWLVPGLIEQKVVAMLRSLPKPLRRNLVPIPDTARRMMETLRFGEGTIEQAVAAAASRLAGQPVSPGDFQLDRLPDALRMNICVVDDNGETRTAGRDLETLRRELGAEVAETFQSIDDPRWNRDGVTSWDFGELPAEVTLHRGGMHITAHPMLVDQGDCVAIRLADSPERAALETRRGLMRLFAVSAKRDLRTQAAWLPNLDRLMLYSKTLPDFDFKRHVTELMADRAIDAAGQIPRDAEAFAHRVQQGRARIPAAVQDVIKLIGPLLESYHEAVLAAERVGPAFQYAKEDVQEQIARLTAPGFLLETPWEWLVHYPRYFRAIAQRLGGLTAGAGSRDAQGCDEVRAYWYRYETRFEHHEGLGLFDPQLAQFRWMIEEYRVSLFAQKLGTAIKISPTRLEKQWEKTRG